MSIEDIPSTQKRSEMGKLLLASPKHRIETFLIGNPEAERYVSSLSKDDTYPVSWSLERTFRWLAERFNWPIKGIVAKLLDMQEEVNMNRSERQRMSLEDLLIAYSSKQVTGTRNYKMHSYNCVHGLFGFNHVTIPSSKEAEKIKGDRPPVNGRLSPDEIRRIIDACKPAEKAIFALMYQGMLDRERFTILNESRWPEIKKQLADESEWIRVGFDMRKGNHKPYYVKYHKDSDAIRFLRAYLKERGEPRGLGRDERGSIRYEAIFINKEGNPYQKDGLSLAWTQAAARSGVLRRAGVACEVCHLPMVRQQLGHEGHHGRWWVCRRCGLKEKASSYREDLQKVRYGKNLHEIRDTLITILPTMAAVNKELVEFFAGHQVDPLDYQKFMNLDDSWIDEEWSKARPYLDVWTNPAISKKSELADENKRLRDDFDSLRRFTEKKIEELTRLRSHPSG